MGARARLAAHVERRLAPRQPRSRGRDDRSRRAPRRAPSRAGQHPVPRVGAGEPGGPPADASTARSRSRDRVRGEEAARRPARCSLRHARLLFGSPARLHGRVGPAVHRRRARRDGSSLPRGASLPGLAFESARDGGLGTIWEQSPAMRAFRGDAWMPEPCRTCPSKCRRLRRMPVPPVCAHRRRDGGRSGVRAFTSPRALVTRAPTRRRRRPLLAFSIAAQPTDRPWMPRRRRRGPQSEPFYVIRTRPRRSIWSRNVSTSAWTAARVGIGMTLREGKDDRVDRMRAVAQLEDGSGRVAERQSALGVKRSMIAALASVPLQPRVRRDPRPERVPPAHDGYAADTASRSAQSTSHLVTKAAMHFSWRRASSRERARMRSPLCESPRPGADARAKVILDARINPRVVRLPRGEAGRHDVRREVLGQRRRHRFEERPFAHELNVSVAREADSWEHAPEPGHFARVESDAFRELSATAPGRLRPVRRRRGRRCGESTAAETRCRSTSRE